MKQEHDYQLKYELKYDLKEILKNYLYKFVSKKNLESIKLEIKNLFLSYNLQLNYDIILKNDSFSFEPKDLLTDMVFSFLFTENSEKINLY